MFILFIVICSYRSSEFALQQEAKEISVFKKCTYEEMLTNKYNMPDVDINFENINLYHVKDSYDEIWCDFLEENVSEALTHAYQEINIAKSDNTGLIAGRIHLKRACNDLENYFKAAYELSVEFETAVLFAKNWTSTYQIWDRDAKRLILLLASFRDRIVDEWVTDIIWRRYHLIEKREEVGFFPDYRELYAIIGDDALFGKGDFHRAFLWYDLLQIDWEGLDEEVDTELGKKELRIKRDNLWWESFNRSIDLLWNLTDEVVYNSKLVGVEKNMELSDECRERLCEFITKWSDYHEGATEGQPEHIWNASSEYISTVIKDLKTNEDEERNRLRTEVAVAYVILSKARYYQLVSAAKKIEDEELSNDDLAIIMNNLEEHGLSTDKTRYIQDYYEKAKETEVDDYHRIKDTLHLLRSYLHCDEILSILNNGVNSGRVAFYSSVSTFMKMLPETADTDENIGRFSVMHVAYMNDPNEGRILNQWIFDRKEDINSEGRAKADYPFIFIKCFTTRIDDLPMWEMYGDHAQGCCIVMDLDMIMKQENKYFPIYNVCYIKKKGSQNTK